MAADRPAFRRVRRSAACATIALVSLLSAAPVAAQNGRGYGAPQPAQSVYVPDPPLAPGDMVRLRFWQEAELSGDFPVDERGLVTLPLLGVRQVTQWPADQVKTQLIQDYSRQLRDQPAQVTMLRRVRVLGAVQTPGLYHVDPTMRIGDVLALAGGVTEDAKSDRVRILRNGRMLVTRLDASALLYGLRSGDQIMVPRRSWIERNAAILIGAALSGVAIIARS